MDKLILEVDLLRIDKTRAVQKEFTTQAGEQVKKMNYRMEAVPLKPENQKVITSGVNQEGKAWELRKTHFIVQAQTKEEKQAQVKSLSLGDGLQFVEVASAGTAGETLEQKQARYPSEEINPDDIPF